MSDSGIINANEVSEEEIDKLVSEINNKYSCNGIKVTKISDEKVEEYEKELPITINITYSLLCCIVGCIVGFLLGSSVTLLIKWIF